MSKSKRTVLVTGATGFIGGAIVLELLKRTDADLACLVRPRRTETIQARLRASLQSAADMYAEHLSAEDLGRCRAIAGDITRPAGGVEVRELGEISECWHVAASLAFEDERADEILLHNKQGTKNIVDLAKNSGCDTFNYVSTAYVAGTRRGTIHEASVADDTIPNNQYELSKIGAERIVEDAAFGTTRVLRPSIVIGHSQTCVATSFSGLYGFIRGLQRARDEVRESLGDLLKFRALRILASADTPVNFIPIDYVARAAVDIAGRDGTSGIYHLTNTAPPRLADCWDSLTSVLDMVRPVYVTDSNEFTLIDQKVDDEMAFYRSYLSDEKHFDVTNTVSVLGSQALRCSLDANDIARHVEWYLKIVESRRARIPVSA